jgi:tellurite methyltransferase
MAAPVSPDGLVRLLFGDPVHQGPTGLPPHPLPGLVTSHRRIGRAVANGSIGDRPVIVDIRSREAYRRGHIRGAVCVPRERLPRSLFLLPPRERYLLLIGRDGAAAAEGAQFLAGHGRPRVAWLDGSPRDLPRRWLRPGVEANRAWEPAPLLREFIARLPRTGEAIDLACGSGREAAFLALVRPRVLGIDILADAGRQARALARAAGVPPGRLTLRRADLTDPRTVGDLLRPRRFRIILCFRYLDRALLPVVARALAPGGWVMYQTFLEAQAKAGRKPRRPAFLLRPGELRRAFESDGGIEVMHYTEGPNDRGDHLASLVGRARG